MTVPVGTSVMKRFPTAIGGIVLLSLVTSLQMLGRSVFTILLPVMKANIGFSDMYLGLLQGPVGMFLASLLALQASWLLERRTHATLLTIILVAWIVATCICGVARLSAVLLLARLAAATTEFMIVPLVYAWLPILVGRRRMIEVNMLFGAIVSVGASAGYAVGPAIIAALEMTGRPLLHALGLPSWQVALIFVGLAGVPMLAMAGWVMRPWRHRPEPVRAPEERGGKRTELFTTKLVWFFVAASLLSLSVQASESLLSVALTQRYETTLVIVGDALGTGVMLTSMSGFAIVWFIDRLSGRLSVIGQHGVMALGVATALPLSQWIGHAATLDGAVTLNIVFLLSTCVANALVPTILQNLTAFGAYKRVFALYSVWSCAIGSLGPAFVGASAHYLYDGDFLLAIRSVSFPALAIGLIVLLWNVRILRRKPRRDQACGEGRRSRRTPQRIRPAGGGGGKFRCVRPADFLSCGRRHRTRRIASDREKIYDAGRWRTRLSRLFPLFRRQDCSIVCEIDTRSGVMGTG